AEVELDVLETGKRDPAGLVAADRTGAGIRVGEDAVVDLAGRLRRAADAAVLAHAESREAELVQRRLVAVRVEGTELARVEEDLALAERVRRQVRIVVARRIIRVVDEEQIRFLRLVHEQV